jgi:hypothetical protein
LTLAIPEAVIHHRASCAFSEGMQEEHGNLLKEWERQVEAWETDQTNECPYDLPEDSE